MLLIHIPSWLTYSLNWSVTKSQKWLIYLTYLSEWVFGTARNYGIQTYLQKTAVAMSWNVLLPRLVLDKMSDLNTYWDEKCVAQLIQVPPVAALFSGFDLTTKGLLHSKRQIERWTRSSEPPLFCNPFINKGGQKTTIFPRMWYTSYSLMLLSGRNWLGWALHINVVEFCSIVLTLIWQSQRMGATGGGQHLFKQVK